MTYPRAHTVDPDQPGVYHCTSRCVRRAWLCGQDELTGRSFDHRKAWIEARIIAMTEVFAVTVSSFAVMSNHYHVVARLDPRAVDDWSDEQVAEHWLKLSRPARADKHAAKVGAIVGNPERLAELRKRLGSLSWYMKSINEPIARQSNREDGCTGRFWEGRFFSEALLDEGSVAAAMAYVDLNPVRAGMVEAPEQAAHTALARRISPERAQQRGLTALAAHHLTLKGYLALLRWTVQVRGGIISPEGGEPPKMLPCSATDWLVRYESHRKRARARGCRQALRAHAAALGQHWLWGVRTATVT